MLLSIVQVVLTLLLSATLAYGFAAYEFKGKPSFAAMAILNGMNSWNHLLWPFMVLSDERKIHASHRLKTLPTPYGNNYDLLIVGSFFSILPVFILFIAFQRFFIDGMTAGAMKG